MNMRKFGLLAALTCAVPAAAATRNDNLMDKEVWITIGSDALAVVQESLRSEGQPLKAPVVEQDGVAALRVRESELERVAAIIHGKLHRCAGFVGHDTEAEARMAVSQATAQGVSPLALTYVINNSASVTPMLNAVEELNIRNTINTLSSSWTNRYYKNASGLEASNWLKNQWTSLAAGRSDITVELFAHTFVQSSVIATITGTTHPNEVVVIGGHLDSINGSNPTNGTAPGADDDASGVASVTEIFRLAMANGYRPARTVKFIAYAGEEVGLYGSKAIANDFKAKAVNVVGVLQLDMTNYKGSSYDFGMVTDNTNAALNSFTTQLITTYQPGLTYTNIQCGYGCSDHASWTAAGYPSSMPFEATMSTDNKQIHTAGDTLTYTGGNANNSVKFAKLGASFLAELAKGATSGNTPPPTDGGGGGTGGTANVATFDSTYKTPRCAAAGASCESGSLLKGRGSAGPEVNKPNTLGATCADGTSGTYLQDESNEALKVSTTDGSNLAAGKTVTVSATVFSYSASSDKLDLYYSASATSPSWKLIGTYSPSTTGTSTISATFTLPSGSVQAVRANFRYQGSAGTCTTGAYDDRDDLVFAVQ